MDRVHNDGGRVVGGNIDRLCLGRLELGGLLARRPLDLALALDRAGLEGCDEEHHGQTDEKPETDRPEGRPVIEHGIGREAGDDRHQHATDESDAPPGGVVDEALDLDCGVIAVHAVLHFIDTRSGRLVSRGQDVDPTVETADLCLRVRRVDLGLAVEATELGVDRRHLGVGDELAEVGHAGLESSLAIHEDTDSLLELVDAIDDRTTLDGGTAETLGVVLESRLELGELVDLDTKLIELRIELLSGLLDMVVEHSLERVHLRHFYHSFPSKGKLIWPKPKLLPLLGTTRYRQVCLQCAAPAGKEVVMCSVQLR